MYTCRLSEDHVEKKRYELSKNRSSELQLTNTVKKSIGFRQTSMPCKLTPNSNISGSSSPPFLSTTTYETCDNFNDAASTISSGRSSEMSDLQKNMSPKEPDIFIYENAKSSTVSSCENAKSSSISSSPIIPTKCFVGGTQRRKKKSRCI